MRLVCYKSFTYPNFTAVFHVQTLKQSFMYPNLEAVFHVSKPYRQQPKRNYSSLPNHQLQAVLHKKHYDSVVALDGGLCSEFPTLQTSAVETATMVV